MLKVGQQKVAVAQRDSRERTLALALSLSLSLSLCRGPFASASAQLLNFPLPRPTADVGAVNCYLLLRQWQQQL